MADRDLDGLPMIFNDETVRPVWRRWLCDCGGEFRHSGSESMSHRMEHRHYCDKCFEPRTADEIYPKIAYLNAGVTQ